jgi:hypothetical protein
VARLKSCTSRPSLRFATVRLEGLSPRTRPTLRRSNRGCAIGETALTSLAAKLLTKDEARRIAANIAKLPGSFDKATLSCAVTFRK